MKQGRPVNLRLGRTTVVTLPSGEVVALEAEREKGHLLLRISAPLGSKIAHVDSILAVESLGERLRTIPSDWPLANSPVS
jgi:hypothetical protein